MKQLILATLILFVSTQAHADLWEAIKGAQTLIKKGCGGVLQEAKLVSQFKKAQINGQVTKTAFINHTRVALMSEHARKVKLPELMDLLEFEDELYAFSGHLFRVRKSDSSVIVLPEKEINELLEAGVLHVEEMAVLRLSWPQRFVFPKRPDLKAAAKYLAGTHSKWNIENDNYIYEVRLKGASNFGANAGSGAFDRRLFGSVVEDFYFTLRIIFAPGRTIFYINKNEFMTNLAGKFLEGLAAIPKPGMPPSTIMFFPMSFIAKSAQSGLSLETQSESLGLTLENLLKVQPGFVLIDKYAIQK